MAEKSTNRNLWRCLAVVGVLLVISFVFIAFEKASQKRQIDQLGSQVDQLKLAVEQLHKSKKK